MDTLKEKARSLRKDIIEMVFRSSAGHVGGDLSVIDILTVLYFQVMNISPENQNDPNRDRFLLSKGHCADALYCVLGEKGFFDKREAVENFSHYGSRFIGHPSAKIPGVEINSGSLGHGLSVGAGFALAAKHDERPYRTYVVLGDGELAEGSNYEAMMLASHYKLDNLCATVDLNGLQISGETKDVMCLGDIGAKFADFGWQVFYVEDGHNHALLVDAYEKAAQCKGRPSVVIAATTKGKGVSFMENNPGWHHGVMTKEQYECALQELSEVPV